MHPRRSSGCGCPNCGCPSCPSSDTAKKLREGQRKSLILDCLECLIDEHLERRYPAKKIKSITAKLEFILNHSSGETYENDEIGELRKQVQNRTDHINYLEYAVTELQMAFKNCMQVIDSNESISRSTDEAESKEYSTFQPEITTSVKGIRCLASMTEV